MNSGRWLIGSRTAQRVSSCVMNNVWSSITARPLLEKCADRSASGHDPSPAERRELESALAGAKHEDLGTLFSAVRIPAYPDGTAARPHPFWPLRPGLAPLRR